MIYLVPEFKTATGEIFNMVNQDQKPIGYIAYIFKEKEKLYVFGNLQNKGEEQNYIDIVREFIHGLQQTLDVKDHTQIFIDVGGEALALDADQDKEEPQS